MAEEDKQVAMTESADTEMVEDNETPDAAAALAELEDTRKALKRANREAAERRKQLEAYEKAEAERKQAEMSELEKANARTAEMEARAKKAEAQISLIQKESAFYAAAEEADLTWANEQARRDAVLLLDLSSLEDDEIADEVKKLKTDRPYLFKQATMPDTDGTKRGSKKPLKEGEMDEERIAKAAQKYGVRI